MTWTAPKLCKSDQLCEVRSQEGDVYTPPIFRKECGIDRLQRTSEITSCKRVCKLLILKGAKNAQERAIAKECASRSRKKSSRSTGENWVLDFGRQAHPR